jgi:hypothetical protein
VGILEELYELSVCGGEGCGEWDLFLWEEVKYEYLGIDGTCISGS